MRRENLPCDEIESSVRAKFPDQQSFLHANVVHEKGKLPLTFSIRTKGNLPCDEIESSVCARFPDQQSFLHAKSCEKGNLPLTFSIRTRAARWSPPPRTCSQAASAWPGHAPSPWWCRLRTFRTHRAPPANGRRNLSPSPRQSIYAIFCEILNFAGD